MLGLYFDIFQDRNAFLLFEKINYKVDFLKKMYNVKFVN
jgi:hypothetical protein